jgi:hypothetical protein
MLPVAVDVCADAAIAAGLAPRRTGRRGSSACGAGPLVDRLPPGCALWLDGGHNEDGGQLNTGVLSVLRL